MEFSIEQVSKNIRVVDVNRNYWFIRSYGGELYYTYLERSYIAIGLNLVPFKLVEEASRIDLPTYERLKQSLANQYQFKSGEVTRWANQLIEFYKHIKVDDMVIMPSRGSEKYAFGIVESSPYLVEEKNTFKFDNKFEPYPEKRRKVKWLKEIHKSKLNGDLKSLSTSHWAITNASNFSEVIEGNLSSLFIKENKIYLTLKVNQDEEINAFDFNNFLSGLTYFYQEFCNENGIENNEELYLKIQVQSPGKIALKASHIWGVLGIAALIAFSGHNDIKVELGNLIKLDAKSDGPFQTISDFLKAKQEREIRNEKWQDSINKLKVGTIHHPVKANEESVIHHPSATKAHGNIIINETINNISIDSREEDQKNENGKDSTKNLN